MQLEIDLKVTEEEVWKDVVGFEGLYQVSSFGAVKSIDRYVAGKNNSTRYMKSKLLRPSFTRGYPKVVLSAKGRLKSFTVHRLVALAFISNPDNKPDTNHIDNNPANNNVGNLEWVTAFENIGHAAKQGRMKYGENHHRYKFTPQDVIDIKDKHINKGFKYRELAEEYATSTSMIWQMLKDKNRGKGSCINYRGYNRKK